MGKIGYYLNISDVKIPGSLSLVRDGDSRIPSDDAVLQQRKVSPY